MFLLAISLFLVNAMEYSSCERFNIVPSPDSPCPGEFAGEPCLTLEQYVANPSLSANITLELQPGNHRVDSQLSKSNINSFTMRANTSATVICNQQLDLPFNFNQLQKIHINGIIFVGCRMNVLHILNATFDRSSFVNRTRCQCYAGTALNVQYSSVLIRQSIISNNKVYYGAIYSSQSDVIIKQTVFRINYYPNNCCSSGKHGGAIHLENGNIDIRNSYFSSNSVPYDDHGGGIYISNAATTITSTYFCDNRAGSTSGHGGAIYFDGSNITITNSTFINNTAIAGGGGVLYSARRYTNISLMNNIFSHNTAAYCGVIDVDEFYHGNVTVSGCTFIYNRAVGLTAGNNGGGVICIRNASMTISDNTFSHNSAIGDAGVIRIDESNVVIEKSIFNNNTAGGDGGVFHTYFYPNQYMISHSTFTNNQAGDDGGVMYVGRAGSHVIISHNTFSDNHANERGGVMAILGSILQINGVNNFENNTAELGKVVSACRSNVTFTNAGSKFLVFQDPLVPFCTLYDSVNLTAPPTTVPNIITESTTGHQTEASTPKNDKITTTTLAPTSEVTSTEAITITTAKDKHKPTTFSPPEETTQNGDLSPTTHPSTPATTESYSTTIDVSTKDSELTTTSNPTSEAVTVTKDDTLTHTTPESTSTTKDSSTTTTSPTTTKWIDKSTTTDTSVEDHTTTIAKNDSSESTTVVLITKHATTPTDVKQRPSDSPTLVVQANADARKVNLHYIIPGYASLGLSVILFIFFILMITVKVYRKKSQPPSQSRKNEYTLIEVQAKE